MKTHSWAMALIIASTLFTATGQFMWKFAADQSSGILGIILSHWLYLGFLAYGLGMILMILSFRGGELTILYPLLATSFIWVLLASNFLLGEALSTLKIVSVLTIVVGICFVGISK